MVTQTKIFWSDPEWDDVALKLAEWRPDRMVNAKLNLGKGEIGEAMVAALPRNRWRPKDGLKPCLVTSYLHQAYKRLRERTRKTMNHQTEASVQRMPKPSAQVRAQRVRHLWTSDEWDAVAVEMERLNPGIFAGRLKSMRIPTFRLAQQVLPKERQKNIAALEIPRNGLLKAWDQRVSRLIENKQVSLSPPPVEQHAADQPTNDEVHTGQWSMEEWVTFATEIHRINPHQNFLHSKTLAGLKPSDMKPAMRALPDNRRRKITTSHTYKKKLLEAFAILRARIEDEKLATPVATVEVKEVAAIPELNKYEAAVAPLVKLFVEELSKAFAPMMAKMLEDMATNSVQSTRQEKSAAGDDDAKKHSAVNGAGNVISNIVAVKRESLPRVAVIGIKGGLQRRLENSFKNINFSFIDASNHPARRMHDLVRNCDRVIGAAKFISHSTERVISNEVGDRYQVVHGGVTGIERQIAVWMTTGVIKNVGNLPISIQ